MQISCDFEFLNINFLNCLAWLPTLSPTGKKNSTGFSTWVTGFFEARKACCGTGTLETSLLCNARSPGTCTNATGYVFWDGFHPSEAANQVLAGDPLSQGFSLISWSYSYCDYNSSLLPYSCDLICIICGCYEKYVGSLVVLVWEFGFLEVCGM